MKRHMQHCYTALSYVDGKADWAQTITHLRTVLYTKNVQMIIVQDSY